jgi:hypothetical protein
MDYSLNKNIESIQYINEEGLICLEQWTDLIGYLGYFKISDLGRVLSLDREIIHSNGRRTNFKGRILKNHISKRGYYITDVTINKLKKTFNIHRLIAIHFIPNPLNKEQVNHKDSNPLNNSINNLEWVTNLENSCHRVKSRNYSSKYLGVGWDKWKNQWKCQIYFKGRRKHIGMFKTEEEAYEARVKFEKDNGIENKYL